MRAVNTSRGFTLVEILIVVTILGTLGAIVIPQFTSASAEAKRAALAQQLQGIRKQIQLYMVQHDDTPPALSGNDWSDLTSRQVINGVAFSPYLPFPPKNPLNSFSAVAVVADDVRAGDTVAAANAGFVYNPSTARIWATNSTGKKIFNEDNLADPAN